MRGEKEELEEMRRDLTHQFNERDFNRTAEHENQINSLKREIDLLEISNQKMTNAVKALEQQANVDKSEIKRLQADVEDK